MTILILIFLTLLLFFTLLVIGCTVYEVQRHTEKSHKKEEKRHQRDHLVVESCNHQKEHVYGCPYHPGFLNAFPCEKFTYFWRKIRTKFAVHYLLYSMFITYLTKLNGSIPTEGIDMNNPPYNLYKLCIPELLCD